MVQNVRQSAEAKHADVDNRLLDQWSPLHAHGQMHQVQRSVLLLHGLHGCMLTLTASASDW